MREDRPKFMLFIAGLYFFVIFLSVILGGEPLATISLLIENIAILIFFFVLIMIVTYLFVTWVSYWNDGTDDDDDYL